MTALRLANARATGLEARGGRATGLLSGGPAGHNTPLTSAERSRSVARSPLSRQFVTTRRATHGVS
ncbi:hypothetical protein EDF19_0869 [Curtobacterium sp. PhB115]|nr:hypothetical protein EDF19_0869 [Curtobacterium sp. PhB115]